MRLFTLALKDLDQIVRDRKSLLFLVAMPIVFTLFMGLAYRGGEPNAETDPRLKVAWVAETPESAMAVRLFERLSESGTINAVRMESVKARRALESKEVLGVLTVPATFGGATFGTATFGTATESGTGDVAAPLTLVADPASASTQALYRGVQITLTELLSAREIARLSVALMPESNAEAAFETAWSAWGRQSGMQRVVVERATAPEPEAAFGGNPYNQASPGILVQFAIMGLVASAQILVQERKTRTLQRLLTTSMPAWEVVAGHMLAMFVITLAQTLLLVALGQGLLGVDYLREAGATLLIAIALGLWVACMGLFIGVLARSDDQVVLFSMMAMFIFSAMGGTSFPLEFAGQAFAAIGRLLPATWAMIGLQNIVIRGQGLESVWLPISVLMAYAVVFFGLAVWRFPKAMA